MDGFSSQRQDSMKRGFQDRNLPISSMDNYFAKVMAAAATPPSSSPAFVKNPSSNSKIPSSIGFDDDLVAAVVPPVTVAIEGRSICHRISLHKHDSYQSLARALRQMFVDDADVPDKDLNLSNAVPGHLIAYEDIEDDLLLAGDLNWKDFVRVAKRIRILPVKTNSRKGRGGA
ncbi:auxin-responsive protein IAA33 [Rhodamnia argentea]|uniref:Auxin-responsive protein n=1 Tax=Rhodamnia argentea TaxID=178133 RepID=A0A8B8QAN2_9MYRT|nr:auxin-responsive protein IAA33 [Rhodamnia argentea]